MPVRYWTAYWSGPGGGLEVLRLALPLIISNSFWTMQITIDRVLLSQYDSLAVGAAMAGVLVFWTCFTLIQNTAAYATTFVAQYLGAGRPERVGPVVWQSFYFSLAAGLAFLLFLPFCDTIIAWFGHSPELQVLESAYFRCLCFAALPMTLTASATSLFLGQGKNWVVMCVNGVGMTTNAILDYALIYGKWGFPEWGIAGAGWATVAGSWTAALLAIAFCLLPNERRRFNILGGYGFDRFLFGRLMRFGFPSGIQWAMDGIAFTMFQLFIGRLGDAQLSATSIAFTLNLVAFLPTAGIGQAVMVLVGQRLGEDKPDLAERSVWSGFVIAWTGMALIGASFVVAPDLYLQLFRSRENPELWSEVSNLVPMLLRFVALYCLFDSMNLVFSFALKGAGDTRFVTLVTVSLVWPIMVLPSWASWYFEIGLAGPWTAASCYIVTLGIVFLWRFRKGQWKTMRVIENVPVDVASLETVATEPLPLPTPEVNDDPVAHPKA